MGCARPVELGSYLVSHRAKRGAHTKADPLGSSLKVTTSSKMVKSEQEVIYKPKAKKIRQAKANKEDLRHAIPRLQQ